ncbi:acyl-CoA synthetase [compost metagenome]
MTRDQAALALGDIVAFLRGLGLAPFKLPEAVEVWPRLPKNDAGKVLKHDIRASLIAARTEG